MLIQWLFAKFWKPISSNMKDWQQKQFFLIVVEQKQTIRCMIIIINHHKVTSSYLTLPLSKIRCKYGAFEIFPYDIENRSSHVLYICIIICSNYISIIRRIFLLEILPFSSFFITWLDSVYINGLVYNNSNWERHRPQRWPKRIDIMNTYVCVCLLFTQCTKLTRE